jgi:nucleotide-binding universal stress UspA family protein
MFRVILIATDGTQAGDAAVAFAGNLAIEQGWCRVRVVHVDELIPGHGGLHHSQALEPEIQTRVKDQVADLQADGLDAEYELRQVVTRNPARAIAEAASTVDADLIVLGNVEDGRLRGLLPGGVAHRLLQIAPCPVLVVPKTLGPENNGRVPLRVVRGAAEG